MSGDHPSAMGDSKEPKNATDTVTGGAQERPAGKPADWPTELGGPKGPEPTRYGDWERKGRCSDF